MGCVVGRRGGWGMWMGEVQGKCMLGRTIWMMRAQLLSLMEPQYMLR